MESAWKNEGGVTGDVVEELETEVADDAEDLELEDLSDEEEIELPPVPGAVEEEEESEW